MNAAHTPGPWLAVPCGQGFQIKRPIEDGPIAHVYGTFGDGLDEADAHLIAAAPYMYDALAHIRDSVHLAGYFRDVAADAIAKATGARP